MIRHVYLEDEVTLCGKPLHGPEGVAPDTWDGRIGYDERVGSFDYCEDCVQSGRWRNVKLAMDENLSPVASSRSDGWGARVAVILMLLLIGCGKSQRYRIVDGPSIVEIHSTAFTPGGRVELKKGARAYFGPTPPPDAWFKYRAMEDVDASVE